MSCSARAWASASALKDLRTLRSASDVGWESGLQKTVEVSKEFSGGFSGEFSLEISGDNEKFAKTAILPIQ